MLGMSERSMQAGVQALALAVLLHKWGCCTTQWVCRPHPAAVAESHLGLWPHVGYRPQIAAAAAGLVADVGAAKVVSGAGLSGGRVQVAHMVHGEGAAAAAALVAPCFADAAAVCMPLAGTCGKGGAGLWCRWRHCLGKGRFGIATLPASQYCAGSNRGQGLRLVPRLDLSHPA